MRKDESAIELPQIVKHRSRCEIVDTTGINENLTLWLIACAQMHKLTYLLAHAEDGVIWGRFDYQGEVCKLITAREAAGDCEDPIVKERALQACPALRTLTLLQGRVFGKAAEVLLWRDEQIGGSSWRARRICEVSDDAETEFREALDETQMLWGDTPNALSQDFTLWTEGAQGLRHIVPLASQARPVPPRLCVRHYLASGGPARIAISRLVNLYP